MRRRVDKSASQGGFTIVELMVATAVLSVILLIVTIVLTGIGNLYSKGVNTARVQDDVRAITNNIADQLQLSTNVTSVSKTLTEGTHEVTESALCVDSTRYSYVTGVRIGQALELADGSYVGSVFPHVLWEDTYNGTCVPADMTAASPSVNGTELISPNSSLNNFSFTDNGSGSYTVSVGVAYGETNLLVDNGNGLVCSGQNGGNQYCATADLTTTVVSRVSGASGLN